MKLSLAVLFITFIAAACARKLAPDWNFDKTRYQAKDHTAENLFSSNIEGPAVDRSGRLFVVNYEKDGTIGLVHPNGSVELFLLLPENSTGNSIQFKADGRMLVADFTGHNILEIDPETKRVAVYCHEPRFNQPNDICIHSNGMVFASDPNWKEGTGQLWRIDPDRRAVLLAADMGTTNGICLSPDEKTLYVNESIQRNIWAFDLDAKGGISNKRLLTTVSDHGFDGMKCDRDGNLYVTRYGKGTVAIYNRGGKLIREVSLKGKKVSNITFGGKDGKTAFVTLQDRKGIEKFRVDAGSEFK